MANNNAPQIEIKLPEVPTKDDEVKDGGTSGSKDLYTADSRKWDQLDQDELVERTQQNKN